MSEEDRDKAFANAQLQQRNSAPRSYLDIYLSNKQLEDTNHYRQATTLRHSETSRMFRLTTSVLT